MSVSQVINFIDKCHKCEYVTVTGISNLTQDQVPIMFQSSPNLTFRSLWVVTSGVTSVTFSSSYLEGFLLFLVGLDCLETDLLPPPISSVGVIPPSSASTNWKMKEFLLFLLLQFYFQPSFPTRFLTTVRIISCIEKNMQIFFAFLKYILVIFLIKKVYFCQCFG